MGHPGILPRWIFPCRDSGLCRVILSLCEQDFGGGDRLSDVALGVIGAVDDEARDGSGQLLAADCARFRPGLRIDGANAGLGGGDSLLERFEKRVTICGGGQFFGHRSQLVWVQRFFFGVGEQAVEAAHDVAHMKCDGRQVVRASGEFFLTQRCAPATDIFAGEFECVEYGALLGGQLYQRAAQPRLGL